MEFANNNRKRKERESGDNKMETIRMNPREQASHLPFINVPPSCSWGTKDLDKNETLTKNEKSVLKKINSGKLLSDLEENEKEIYKRLCWGALPPLRLPNNFKKSYISKLGVSIKDVENREANENYLLSGPKQLLCNRTHSIKGALGEIDESDFNLKECIQGKTGDDWVRVYSLKSFGRDAYWKWMVEREKERKEGRKEAPFDFKPFEQEMKDAMNLARANKEEKENKLKEKELPQFNDYINRLVYDLNYYWEGCVPYKSGAQSKKGANMEKDELTGRWNMSAKCAEEYGREILKMDDEGWEIIFGKMDNGIFKPNKKWYYKIPIQILKSHNLFVTLENDILFRLYEKGFSSLKGRSNLHKRIYKLLGLNTSWGPYNKVLSFEIQIKNLVRPCQENLVIQPDGTGGESVKCKVVKLDQENGYMSAHRKGNLGDNETQWYSGRAPFTGMGYTYDIGGIDSEESYVTDIGIGGKLFDVKGKLNAELAPQIQGCDEYILPYGVRIRDPKAYTWTEYTKMLMNQLSKQKRILDDKRVRPIPRVGGRRRKTRKLGKRKKKKTRRRRKRRRKRTKKKRRGNYQ